MRTEIEYKLDLLKEKKEKLIKWIEIIDNFINHFELDKNNQELINTLDLLIK